ncbi:5-formyltetrahydrofolate cyclo-ligase [Moraxella sp. ZJ142]|uniref:5-formyltetrahydrofolate cyclo-ligase n=1 Tax=Moraxella marmotae TaxID=3344520 RepID=UPI0035D43DC2
MDKMHSPAQIRKQIKSQRRKLTDRQRRQSAWLASRFLPKLVPLLPKGAKIAFYLDSFGEMPTAVIAKFCQKYGYQGYLPITRQSQPLTFAPIMATLTKTPLKKHRLGMLEPICRPHQDAKAMDAIICPLVAVDKAGVRLGMGGGYYDRTFERTKHCLKIAWCYEFQVLDKLNKQPWDQSVDIIISDKTIRRIF